MKTKPTWSKQYLGYTITINEYGEFVIAGISRQAFQSLKAAIEHLDKEEAAKKAESRKRVSLKAQDTKGNVYTVTGINARTGALLFTPKPERWSDPDLYFFSRTSERLILERRIAAERVRRIDTLLSPFKCEEAKRTWGSAFDHGKEVDRLQASYNRAMKIEHKDLEMAIRDAKPKGGLAL